MHDKLRNLLLTFVLLVSGCTSTNGLVPSPFTKTKLPGNLVLLTSANGGNVLAIPSEAGVLLIDSGEPSTALELRAEVASFNSGPVRTIINTHYHWDHSGGTSLLGRGAHIYATPATADAWARADKNRPSMANELKATDVVDHSINLTWGGEQLEIEPVAPAHTNGDLIVWVRSRNAIHLADLFQFDGFPSVGLPDGGTHKATVNVLREIIERTDETTLVIPGHGDPTNRDRLIDWTNMLDTVISRVEAAVHSGLSVEETIASHPTAEFDQEWGNGYLKPDEFVQKIYRDITGYYVSSPQEE